MVSAANLPLVSTLGGNKVPVLAFGVGTALYKQDCSNAIRTAFGEGFRFLDGAEMYANAEAAGKGLSTAFQDNNLDRKDVFVLDKIGSGMKESVIESAKVQLSKYGLSYFDGLLLHYPPRGSNGNPSNVDAWKAMEQLKDEGLAKAIGVSNWLAKDIQEVIDSAPKHNIEINQIELHPFVYSSPLMKETLALQQQQGIVTMIYSSLGPITKESQNPLLPIMERIAESNSYLTPGAVLQKWASQVAATGPNGDDAIIISTSNKKDRCREYLDAFEKGKGGERRLTHQEMDEITREGEKHGLKKYYMSHVFN